MTIFDDIYLLFWQLADYIADLFGTFINWITTSFASVVNFLNSILTALNTNITNTLRFVRDVFQALYDGLTAWLSELVNSISNAFITAWNIVRDAVVGYLNTMANFANNLFAQIRASISTVMTNIGIVFTQFTDKIEGLVNQVLLTIFDTYESVVAGIQSAVQSLLSSVTGLLTTAQATVTATLQGLIEGPAAVFNALSGRFNDIGTALREKIDGVIAVLGELPESVRETVDEMVTKLLNGLLSWTNAPELNGAMNALTQLVSTGGQPVQYQAFISQVFSLFTPQSTLARGIVFILLVVVAAIPAALNVATIYAQPMIQSLAAEFPYALLSPPDAVTAWRKGLISQNAATEIIKRQGFSNEDATTLMGLSEAVPTEDVALALWHRDLLNDQQLDEALHERGFTQVWRNRFREASFIIPPIQDLIVMAVREVFSPDVAERFGQFDDFPAEFAAFAAKQGLTKEWALRYWAAHWGLPSATQGFEMLHRGVITEEDLHLLLRSLDVMPFWRERLTKIAYLPYTRVDIRRMHQVGVLSDEDVMRAHLDLGYEQEKAERLTEFVLRLNRNAPGEDDAELGRLSRTAVLAFYRDGLLARPRAAELLTSLGLTPEAASLYLDSVDFDEERLERKAETDIIIAQAEAGTITFAEAQDKLNALGLETREVERALTRLARSEKARVKLPSREDGERFLKLRLITGAGYKDLLLRLGYSPFWADMYVAAVLAEGEKNVDQG